MPWVSPEAFMVRNNVIVYHVYKDDDYNQPPREYWFGLTQHCNEDDGSFDVRDLPSIPEDKTDHYKSQFPQDWRKARIAYAIDSGYFEGWEKDEPPAVFTSQVYPEKVIRPLEEACKNFLHEAEYAVTDEELHNAVEAIRAALPKQPTTQPNTLPFTLDELGNT